MSSDTFEKIWCVFIGFVVALLFVPTIMDITETSYLNRRHLHDKTAFKDRGAYKVYSAVRIYPILKPENLK